MGPIDYVGGFQNTVPDPSQAFTQGLQMGGFARKQRQEEEARLAQQAQQQQYQQDMAALFRNPNPTARDYAQLTVKYPQLKDQFKQSWDLLSGEQQGNKTSLMTQAYAALTTGRTDVAEKLLRDQAAAMRNSGADEREVQAQEMWANMVRDDPANAKHLGGILLSSVMGPDKFASTFTALGGEARAADKAPFELSRAEADAAKARADARIRGVEAASAPEREELEKEKIATDILSSRENSRIKAMEASLARETNDLKRQELQLKIDDAKRARDEKAREKTADAENAIVGVDNSINLMRDILADEDTLRGAVGTSAWRGSIPGTKTRAMAGKIEQLQNAIASVNLDKLKGAMSDKDIMFLKNMETNLDRYQDEDAFVGELNRIYKKLIDARERIVQRTGTAGSEVAEGGVLLTHPKYGQVTERRLQQIMSKAGLSRDEAMEFLSSTQGGASGSY